MISVKKGKRILTIILGMLLVGIMLVSVGCSGDGEKTPGEVEKPKLVFADAGWDSMCFHNDVAKLIIENGYGYETEITPGTTMVTFEGLKRGDIDIYMETWTDNINTYQEALEKEDIKEIAINYSDDRQGFYVPTYVIKGDLERGIEPLAPDLKTIEDLPTYWEIFRDPEDKTKGRIYGAIPGWSVDEIMSEKVKNYGLDETYNLFRPGSETALSTSLMKAVKEGEPWVGYYWEPSWIVGKYDMTYIEEPVYDEMKWNDGYVCTIPSVKITVCVSNEMFNKAPDVVEFLKKYQTSSLLTSEALMYMHDNDVDTLEAAKWFLRENKDLWTKWVPEDVVTKVEEAIK